jgi:hypothetical protein|nr:MAG TPA: hypothetical protein [Caudoviricetes sp.]
MSIGMTPEQYWDGDCTLPRCYQKAHELKLAQRNQEMWTQGLYFYRALCSASPAFNPMAKDPKPLPYLNEPFPLTDKEAREQRERAEKKRMKEQMSVVSDWAERVNSRFAGGES